jgi:demethylmenaquinone methyltransferase/2-methoxy-6-polyprenyl-1,4-benzoquinol methylase
VLKPGGAAAILEFSEPPGKLFGGLYRFYFRNVLPRLGALISGNGAAYTYLPNSVGKFPSPEVLKNLFERTGYADVRFERWTGGIVTLHMGRKL